MVDATRTVSVTTTASTEASSSAAPSPTATPVSEEVAGPKELTAEEIRQRVLDTPEDQRNINLKALVTEESAGSSNGSSSGNSSGGSSGSSSSGGASGVLTDGNASTVQVVTPGSSTSVGQGSSAGGVSGSGEQGEVSGVTSGGAPVLDDEVSFFVSGESDGEQLLIAVLFLDNKVKQSQASSSAVSLEAARVKIDQKHEERLAKLDEWKVSAQQAADEAAKRDSWGIFGAVVAWFAAVAAVVFAVVTFGAASGVAAAAIVGAVAATIALADVLSQKFGGPEVSISSMLQNLASSMLEAFGIPKEEADRAAKSLSAIAMVISGAFILEPEALGDFAEVAAFAFGADPQEAMKVKMAFAIVGAVVVAGVLLASGGGGAASALSSLLQQAAKVVRVGGAIVNGVASVVAGGFSISVAVKQHDADQVQIEKEILEKVLLALQRALEMEEEFLKKITKAMEETAEVLSRVLQENQEAKDFAIAAIGRRAV